MKAYSKSDGVSAPPRNSTGALLGERGIFLFGFICLAAGMVLGYLVRSVDSPPPTVASAPAASSPAPRSAKGPVQSITAIGAPLEAALKSDPTNKALLIQLGNLYSDHRAYPKAIEYYNRALQLDPKNVNVRTDLGTAYWYAGFPQKAVAAYKQALSVDPHHVQALFNLGVVYEQGLKDYAHAISVWEQILKSNPRDENRGRVEQMIESAKQKAAAARQM